MHTMNFNIISFCFSVANSGIEEHKLLILSHAENNGNDSLIAKTIHLLQIGRLFTFFFSFFFFFFSNGTLSRVESANDAYNYFSQ